MSDNISSFTFTRSDLSESYNQNGGVCSRTDLNEIILKAFTDRQPEVASYIIYNMKSKLRKFKETDMYGRNILHYLVIFYYYTPIQNLLKYIMDAPGYYKIKDIINLKDKLGNTPLHYAVMFKQDQVADLLIKNGANPKIKNNDGDFVETDKPMTEEDDDKETEIPIVKMNILETKPTQSENSIIITELDFDDDIKKSNRIDPSKYMDLETQEEVDSALDKIVRSYSNPANQSNHSETISALKNMKSDIEKDNSEEILSDDIKTEELAMRIIKRLKGERLDDLAFNNTLSEKSSKKTRTIPDSPLSIVENNNDIEEKGISTPVELTMGPRAGEPPSQFMEPNTEVMVNKLRDTKSQLIGGRRKNKNKGTRKLHTFSELSYGEAIKTDDDLNEANNKITSELFDKKEKSSSSSSEESEKDKVLASELSEMARNIARQSSDIHERSIQKIAELLKLDLNKPEDNKKARYYKAAIWKMVKEKHPELSNYDRSVEMEKNITKDTLKSIDINKVTKEIDQYFSEKSEKPKESDVSTSSATEEKPKKVKKETKATEKSKSKEVKTKEVKTKEVKAKKSKKDEGSNQTLSISTESSSIYSESSDL